MDDRQFRDHIDRLGDNIAEWPAAVQAEARRHSSRSETAKADLVEARLIREALSASADSRAPKSLTQAIFAAAFDVQAPNVFPALGRDHATSGTATTRS